MPPDIHRRNAAERSIQTFKAHFIFILAGIAPDFPKLLWDHLLPQTEMTLNFLQQLTLDPTKLAWEFSILHLTMPLTLLVLLDAE